MIRAKIVISQGHCFLRTEGHALTEDTGDDDDLLEGVAVCAAVSAVMQNAAYGLQSIAASHPNMLEIALCEMPEQAARLLPSEYQGEKTGVRSKAAE